VAYCAYGNGLAVRTLSLLSKSLVFDTGWFY